MIARLAAVVAAAVPCLALPAHAGPLADALARGDDAAITELRAQPTDPAARCTLGAIFARRGDLPRAGHFLAACEDAELPDDVADAIDAVARETQKKLKGGDLAKIQVWSTPQGVTVESSALPGERFTTPATLWVRPGTHELRMFGSGAPRLSTFVAEARKDGIVMLQAPTDKPAAGPREQEVSFDDDAINDQQAAPPPDLKHKSIMPKKYRGAAGLREQPEGGGEGGGEGGSEGGGGGGGGGGSGFELEDPLAVQAAPRPPRAHWLGARISGGMFDDGHAGARAGLGVAAAGRFALSTRPSGGPALFLAGRLDWSRRGGSPDPSGMEMAGASVDVLGAAAGAGYTVLDRGALSLALIGQLRADLRLASSRADEPVRRAGLGAAAGAELAHPGTPVTAGFRFEHGLTELVPGARDRAVLLEVGLDWR